MKGTMTHMEHISQIERQLEEEVTRTNGWGNTQLGVHIRAWNVGKSLFADVFKQAVWALARYADAHYFKYGSPIGEDGVLGKEWADAVYAVRGLLNGELGGLDGGTLDKMLYGMLQREGFEK